MNKLNTVSAKSAFVAVVTVATLAVVQLWAAAVSAAEMTPDTSGRCIYITEGDGTLVVVCGKKG
jgi:hypothetical protein